MKPKPFSALNHLTVPCAMGITLSLIAIWSPHFVGSRLPHYPHNSRDMPVVYEKGPPERAPLRFCEELQLQPVMRLARKLNRRLVRNDPPPCPPMLGSSVAARSAGPGAKRASRFGVR